MGGVAGFEPATPCSQSRRAGRTALHPENCQKNSGLCARPQQARNAIASRLSATALRVDSVAQLQRGGAGGVGVVVALRGEDDAARGIDENAGAVFVLAVFYCSFDIAALGADARDQ